GSITVGIGLIAAGILGRPELPVAEAKAPVQKTLPLRLEVKQEQPPPVEQVAFPAQAKAVTTVNRCRLSVAPLRADGKEVKVYWSTDGSSRTESYSDGKLVSFALVH